MSNEVIQETTPLGECSAFHRGMSVLEASLRNTEDSEAIINGLLKGAAGFMAHRGPLWWRLTGSLGSASLTMSGAKMVSQHREICSSACLWRSFRDGGNHFEPINQS